MRGLLVVALAFAVVLSACGSSGSKPTPDVIIATRPASARANPIPAENARPGTDAWRITRPATLGEIAGYTGSTSYDRGETVDLHISTRSDRVPYRIELYRMGWYGGAGGRLLTTVDGLTGHAQGYWTPGEGLVGCDRCQIDQKTGLVDANWETSYELSLDPSWPTGVYLAKLIDVAGKEAYVPFAVRDDSRPADLLVQLSVNTWQAYNAWGDRSLYGGFDASRRWAGKDARAYKVSFNRPYDPLEDGLPSNGAGQFFRWEYNFVRWAESQGYDLTYATNVDVHARAGLLDNRRGFVSLGHDEYWSWEQRDNVESARDRGVGLAFFGGNNVYWQVRLEPGADGTANRTLVCYKDAALDPVAKQDPSRTTVLWYQEPVNRPQSLLTGTLYGSNATPEQQDWVVADDTNWIFAGTGLRQGDHVAGIVGYEYDRLGDEASRPPGMAIVGFSPVIGWLGDDTAVSAVYEAASGAPVFSAGTIQWPWGLDDYGHEQIGRYADPRLQAVTRNVLDALVQQR